MPLDTETNDAVSFAHRSLFRDGSPTYGQGIFAQAAEFNGKKVIDLGDVAGFEKSDAFSVGAWVYPTDETDAAIVARMNETHAERGYNLYWQKGNIHFQFMSHVPDPNVITRPMAL